MISDEKYWNIKMLSIIIMNELNEMIPGGNKLNSWLNSKRKVQSLKYRLRHIYIYKIRDDIE